MKPWYKSSTIWLNVSLAVAVTVLTQLEVMVPTEYGVLIAAALNFLNRFRTATAIGR